LRQRNKILPLLPLL